MGININNNNFIYKTYITLCEELQQHLKASLNINEVIMAFLQGCTENTKNMSLTLNKGEDIMKFQGKTIFKNTKCNTWYTRYRENGKQIYISGKTQKEVLNTLKEKLNYVKKEKKKVLTLLDWYNQWLELFKIGKVKDATIISYTSSLKHLPDETLNKNILNISSIEIMNALNKINGDRAKQKVYELLKDLFTKAEQYNICNNILKIIEKPKHNKENGIALTHEDENKFIKYCIDKKYYIYLIALYQGLRKGEVLGLCHTDIDLINNTLNINKSWNMNNEYDTTKNITSTRIMPLFTPTIKILKLCLNTNERLFNISQRAMQNQFRKIIDDLNLNTKYTIHSLRHTFITHCQDHSIPEHIIQNWVGHKIGSDVTKKVYTHIQENTNNLFINKLNNTEFYSNSTHI